MGHRGRLLLSWADEVVAATACVVLVARSWTTVHQRGDVQLLADGAVVAALVVALAAAFVRCAAPGTSVIALAIAVLGATAAADARVAVAAFALSACVGLAALAIGRVGSTGVLVGLAVATAFAVIARLLWRDPFRELRCEPFCDANPFLHGRHPTLVRTAEWLLVIATGAAVVDRTRRRPVGGLAGVVAVSVATLFAVRLVVRPRPVPDSAPDIAFDVALFIGLLLVTLASATHVRSAVTERKAMAAFGRDLSRASDLADIEASLRRSTGDEELRVHLATEWEKVAPSDSTTVVVRAGRRVATIVHDPAQREQVARAVTPSVALALETQLLLDEARRSVDEVAAARSSAARSTDAARRALERNLHDGAQQHMLVTGMTLAAAADHAPPDEADRYRAAADDVGTALAELRRLGRGDAAAIAELGLADAAVSLAGRSSMPVAVTVHQCDAAHPDCWPLEPSTAAYRLLVSTLSEAERGDATEVTFDARCLGPNVGHEVLCRHDGRAGDRTLTEDRVLAAGGRVTFEQRDGRQVAEVWLP